jgi:predicted dehydrogenase
MNMSENTELMRLPHLLTEGRPLRLGVLGAARIVGKALDAAFSYADFPVRVEAIAARDSERARAMAECYGIGRSYSAYAELLSDDAIDAVYIALPCSEHARYCEQALVAGKHVLCEKPFALDWIEASQVLLVAERHKRLVMEGHHWRYHPLLPSVATFIAQLGDLYLISSTFTAGLSDPKDIRKNPALGAGVTMDFGCYTLQWADWAVNISQVSDSISQYSGVEWGCVDMVQEAFGVDVAMHANFSIGGVATSIACDMRESMPFEAFLAVEGDYGLVHFENPLGTQGTWVEFQPNERGIQAGLSLERVDVSPSCETTYCAQLRAFHRALVTGDAPPTSGESILRTQSLLDQMYRLAGLPSRRELRALA